MTQVTPSAVPNGQYAEQIARGAAWLDDIKPDWRAEIDLTELCMTDPDHCVIGQVFGNYYDDLPMTVEDSGRHGFSTESAQVEPWEHLTREWADYIEATR